MHERIRSMGKITYHTFIKSVSAKVDKDSITLEGKEFTSNERDQLISWAKGKEIVRITIEPIQETFASVKPDKKPKKGTNAGL